MTQKFKKLFIEIKKDLKDIIRSILYWFKYKILGSFVLFKPTSLQLSVTGKCNSHCIMCGIWKNQTKNDFTVEELDEYLQDKIFSNIRSTGINGGEPTIRNDLDKILEILIKRCPKIKGISLLSNSINSEQLIKNSLLLDKICQKNNIYFYTMLSLDGIKEIHDQNRCTPGNYENVLNSIKKLQENNLKFSIGCTITPINCYGIDDVLNFCLQNNIKFKFRLAVEIKRIFNTREKDKSNYKFNDNQLFHITNFFEKLAFNKKLSIQAGYSKFYKSIFNQLANKQKRSSGCNWQTRGVSIGPNDEMSYCSVRSPIIGYMHKEKPHSIYKNNLKIRKDIIKKYCDTCQHDLSGQAKPNIVIKDKYNKYKNIFDNYLNDKILWKGKIPKKINLPKNKKLNNVIITGWWGTETAGDKAILGELLHFLKNKNPLIKIDFTSYDDYVIKKTLRELNYKNHYKLYSISKFAKKNIVKKYDAIIIGGGPLMELSNTNYIRKAFLIANKYNIEKIIFGCGISLNLSGKHKKIISDICKLTSKGFFRDKESLDLALKWGCTGNLDYACDPAINYISRWIENNKHLEKQNIITGLLRECPNKYLKTNQTNYEKINNEKLEMTANSFKTISNIHNTRIDLQAMNSCYNGDDDRIYNRKIEKLCSANNITTEKKYLSLNQLLENIYKSKYVIATRYHAHIFSATMIIPFLSIDYTGKQAKIKNFLKMIDYKNSIDFSGLNEQKIIENFKYISDNYSLIQNELKNKKSMLIDKLNNIYSKILN